jgi:hypothetical protein
MDTWQVFQLASLDPWGISPVGVIEICKVIGVEDIEECLYKIVQMNKVFQKEKPQSSTTSRKGTPHG